GAGRGAGAARARAGGAFVRRGGASSRAAAALFFAPRPPMRGGAGARLSRTDYLDVIAYILQQNGYPVGSSELTDNPGVLRAIKLASPDGSGDVPAQERPVAPARMPITSTPTQRELDNARDAADWLMPHPAYAGPKSSTLRRITRKNERGLRPLCMYQVGDLGNFQAMPIVHRGIMYFTTPRLTIALDARTCRLRWKHEWREEGN